MENTKATLMTVKGVITGKIPNGVLVTYENGFIDQCTDEPEAEPFFSNFEIGEEVEWGLLCGENGLACDEDGDVLELRPHDRALKENLKKLCYIIEKNYGIERLSESAMCDFPAYEGAIEKVSAAVGFEVKNTDNLFDIVKRMTTDALYAKS